jgi:DNA-binding YbaB/EbfC family protein
MGKGMRAGKKPKVRNGGGAKDMQKQLKQLQAMQAEMEAKQAELQKKEITTTAGGGAVEVTINGKKEITKLVIDKDVVDPDDVEMLQDLVTAAVNEAIRQIEELEESEMNSITGGLGDMGGFGGLGF